MDQSFYTLFEQFKAAAAEDSMEKDTARAKELLPKLQLKIATQKFGAGAAADAERVRFLVAARETMELALLLCVREREGADVFARRYAQLRPFYARALDALGIARSANEMLMEGLHLMFLLSQNKVGEFYTALEAIPFDARTQNRYIQYPVELEQLLTEGAYAKVLRARAAVPAPCYAPFVSTLTDAVRRDVASCAERAYASLDVPTAMRFLFFAPDDRAGFDACIAALKWSVAPDGRVHFPAPGASTAAGVGRAPSLGMGFTSAQTLSTLSLAHAGAEDGCYRLIQESLSYAKELERIV